MTLHRFPPRQPVVLDGPHRRNISWAEVAISLLAHAAIGTILAVSVLGMSGALS